MLSHQIERKQHDQKEGKALDTERLGRKKGAGIFS